MNKQELIVFEDEIKADFLAAKIRHPVHFSAGNEDQIIEIFKDIKPEDFVFSTHRSHFHALLKGIPKEWLREQIHRGNSMHIMNPEYKFFAASIVAGCCPIAVGVAMAIKRKGLKEHVWVFVGDMSSFCGIYQESITYAKNFNLPISFVVECNQLSTNSLTYEAWGLDHDHKLGETKIIDKWDEGKVMSYCYDRLCPHINCSEWVVFR